MSSNRFMLAADKIRSSVVPLALLLVFFAAISWYIIKPLALPLTWSVLFSYFAYPLYIYLHVKLFRGKFRNFSAAVSTTVILVFIALPLLALSIFVTREAIRISRDLMQVGLLSGSYDDIIATIKALPLFGRFMGNLDILTAELPIVDELIKDSARWVTSFLTSISSHVFESILKLAFVILIIGITSFFLVRDGREMIEYTAELIPLPDEERKRFVHRVAVMLKAVVCGIIFTAAVQGALGALGWWFVGLAHPAFFGFCMFMLAMVPFIGTPVIWLPGSALLLLRGDMTGGIILLLWGLLVVSSIDNLIKPIFISEGSKIHMLLIFIGLFGGLFVWGFLGVFVGPLVLSLALFLLDIYRSIVRDPDAKTEPAGAQAGSEKKSE